ALDRAPTQGCKDSRRAQPGDHVIANRHNRRLLRLSRGTFNCEKARHRGADFIEPRPIRPRSLLTVEHDGCVNQSGFLLAKRIGIKVVLFQKSWPFIGKEYIGILEKLIEPGAILLRVVQYR